jgi:hypothetical protein
LGQPEFFFFFFKNDGCPGATLFKTVFIGRLFCGETHKKPFTGKGFNGFILFRAATIFVGGPFLITL